MEKEAHILKDDDSETVYELVDANDMEVVMENGSPSTHCVFLRNTHDCLDLAEKEAVGSSGEVKGYFWQYDETKALLGLIEKHYDALNHSGKRQLVWKNISKQLQLQNCAIDAGTCLRKWRNMIRTYNSIKHNSRNTGKVIKFQFYNEVHNILNKRMSNKDTDIEEKRLDVHNYAINSKCEIIEENNAPYVVKIRDANVKQKLDEEKEPALHVNISNDEIENAEKPRPKVGGTYVEKISRAAQTVSRISPVKSRLRRKNSLSEFFKLQRLMLMRSSRERQEERKAKEKRFQEKLSLRRDQLELNRKKVELLEAYLSLKAQGKI